MKVKCVNIYNESTQKFEDKSDSLTIGKEYVVLEICISGSGASYRLMTDDEQKIPVLFDSKQFEVTSKKMPSQWIKDTTSQPDGILLRPFQWTSEFWEDVSAGDPIAREQCKLIIQDLTNEDFID